MSNKIINEISALVEQGRAKNVKALVLEAIEQGCDVKQILNEGLLSGMMNVGAKFKLGEVFVPEVLITARAMNAGLGVLEPLLSETDCEKKGKVVIGTVKGDLHDIGKNLVAMMLKGAGFEIIDIGTDADSDKFITTAELTGADIICMSALLTTTMTYMQDIIEDLKARNLRDKYIVMIGGAPINADFAEKIEADFYTHDATEAAEVALKAIESRN